MTDEPAAELSTDEHLEAIRGHADAFLSSIGAASEAGVSQALILPMLLELLRDSGISFDAGAMLGSLG